MDSRQSLFAATFLGALLAFSPAAAKKKQKGAVLVTAIYTTGPVTLEGLDKFETLNAVWFPALKECRFAAGAAVATFRSAPAPGQVIAVGCFPRKIKVNINNLQFHQNEE